MISLRTLAKWRNSLCASMAGFRNATGGSIALTYAIMGVAIVGIAFTGVDMTRVAMARSKLQDSLDSATLAAAASATTETSVINATGKKYLSAALTNDTMLLNLSSTFSLTSKKLTGSATAEVEPIVMGLYTGSNITIKAQSEVVRRQDMTVELALVLDTTGSMAGTKMSTLKTAATDLVKTVLGGANGDKVKIGIVPFAQHVNLGIASRNEAWADVPAEVHLYHPSSYMPSCTKQQCTTSQVSCRIPDYSPSTCTGINDGVPYSYACQVQTGSHQGLCNVSSNCTTVQLNPCPGPVNNSWWEDSHFYGCYGSPAYPDNVSDNNANRKYPGLMNLTCSAQVQNLTTSSAPLLATINSLNASGETYIPAGLAWGFNMLTSSQPLTDALPYDTAGPNLNPRKIIVLMTDGANTKQMNHGAGARGIHNIAANPAPEANTYTTELCNNIKAKGIEVYTVAFDIQNNAAAKTLVQACASDSSHFFDASNSAARLDAFRQITKSIQSLQISH